MNFGVLVFPDVEELDFAGPWEMLTMWQEVADGPENCLIVAESMEPVRCAHGLSINPHVSFTSCPTLDYLLVPGGRGTRKEVNNKALIDFVAEAARNCQSLLSVCTGAFILHAAGVLAGRKATTHWGSLERLRELGDVEVAEQRFVQDERLWSSAGVSAGLDMTLDFIATVAGEDTAGLVQFASEYYPAGKVYGDFRNHPQAPAYIKQNQP